MRKFSPLTAALALAFVLGACGSSTVASSNTKSTTATTLSTNDANSSATTAGAAGSGSVIEVHDSSLGKIITNASGVTLYMFTPDSATSSACTGGCASAWPPVVAPGAKGTGVDDDDLGTLTRSDGTKQVTFYGHPLYTYSGDSAPGDVNGQGTGARWYVLDSEGNPVKAMGGSTATTMASPTTTEDSGY